MNNIDLDELMKLLEERAESREEQHSISKLDSCDKFIKKLNVLSGLDRVPNYVIYYTYQEIYREGLGETKWARNHFFQLFNKHFDSARTGRLRTYLLDGKSFDLTREGLLKAKKFNEEYQIKVAQARGSSSNKRKYRKRDQKYWEELQSRSKQARRDKGQE